MVAVESYLKSHFRPGVGAHTARVPLIPTDFDLSSASSHPTPEESSAIGSKLHRLIDGMCRAAPAPSPAPAAPAHLVSLAEGREPLAAGNYSRETSSLDFDRADVFEDKNVETAVESFQEKCDVPKIEPVSVCSSGELQTLEDALHGRLAIGTFRPRLRIERLTLTPERSTQRVLVVESGDAGSIVLESTVSKSLKLTASRSDATADLKPPSFDEPLLDFDFRKTIPMQIATVGYAFPRYHAAYCGPNSAIKSLDNIFKVGISVSSTSAGRERTDKPSQCFRGSQPKRGARDDRTPPPIERNSVAVSGNTPPSFASVATDTPAFVNVEKTCGDCINMLKDKCQTEAVELKAVGDADRVDCTSSLDILVGLLNEIQKITTCHITDTVQYCDEWGRRELLDVVNGNAAMKETVKNISHELISIASLDKLRQLESSPSIYSLYLSDGEKESIEEKICIPRLNKSLRNALCEIIPNHADKEVAVDFPVKEYTHTFTDVPSTFFPIKISHSTNVSNSLLGILSKSSSQTIVSHEDFDTAYSESTSNFMKIIEIEEEPKVDEICEIIEQPKIEKQVETYNEVVIKTQIVTTEMHKVKSEINLFINHSKCCKNSDFDSLIKIKRDILVTMYSMLVLTVFAALSFPEILYFV